MQSAVIRLVDKLKMPKEDRERIINKAFLFIEKANKNLSPMEINLDLFHIIQDETRVFDPLYELKQGSNLQAIKLIPVLKDYIEKGVDPVLTAIKGAIAGNIIDFSINDNVNLHEILNKVIKQPLKIDNYDILRDKLDSSDRLTILVDNAGEIVFDITLIEKLDLVYHFFVIDIVAKKEPFSNDITVADIEELNLIALPNVRLISCSNAKGENYKDNLINIIKKNPSVVIAKGQGNFELLYGEHLGIFFMFIVKCEEIAKAISAEVGDIVLLYD